MITFSILLIIILVVVGIIVTTFLSFLSKPKKLLIGSRAPEFSLLDDQNNLRSLSDFRGKRIALYFYPKDFTSGCTTQACSIRDSYQDLQNKGIYALGISYDTPESHKKFKELHKLSFPLLSDPNHIVARAYGATLTSWGLWELPFARRITYLINENGIIVGILSNIDVQNHAEQIMQVFANTSL